MAKAKNGLGQLVKDLDRVAASLVFSGPIKACIGIVDDLQQVGPSWSGKFSNSWKIKTPSRLFTCPSPGVGGEPRHIQRPTISGREAVSSEFLKDSIVFEIFNDSPKKGFAMDQQLGWFRRDFRWGLEPQTQKGKNSLALVSSGRQNPSLRGNIGGGPGPLSSRTAPLDWFPTYMRGGQLNRAIRVEMDSAIAVTKRRTQGRLK